jgi:hypothetical protein
MCARYGLRRSVDALRELRKRRSAAWDRSRDPKVASAGRCAVDRGDGEGEREPNRGRRALERDERDGLNFDLFRFARASRRDTNLTRAFFSHRSHSRLLFRNPSSRSASATSSGLPKRLPLPPRPRLRAKRSVRKSSSARRSMSRSTATRWVFLETTRPRGGCDPSGAF